MSIYLILTYQILEHPNDVSMSSQGSLSGVWQCLRSAFALNEPVLAFPVVDLATYKPLPGMNRLAVEDASLPNAGMVQCLQAAGGSAPSAFQNGKYLHEEDAKLRDVLVMKPGSTVEDVFLRSSALVPCRANLYGQKDAVAWEKNQSKSQNTSPSKSPTGF